MAYRRVVVDGSNIATEGRSVPSLAQLDEAVREFSREFPHAEVTVVVDSSFGHRIDESERPAFDEAEAHGEIVSPPAGAIGRGDAFLLRIAEKTGATVLSNDSFQEFHGEHDWLFSQSRLVGGKPVPGVGWIFTARTPVRGPRSRVATQDAKRSRVRVGSKEASKPMPVPAVPPPGRGRRRGERRPFVLQALDPQRRGVELALPEYAHVAGSPSEETVEAEISEATGTDEVVPDPEGAASRKRGQKAKAPEKLDAEKAE